MPSINANPFALPPVPPRRFQRLDRGQRAALYLAGSTALRDILQLLGLTAYKIGVSGRRDVKDRILDLSGRRYASILAPSDQRDRTILKSDCGGEWFVSPLVEPDKAVRALIATLPDGAIHKGVLEFRLPPGRTVKQVEDRVRDLLVDRNINKYLASQDGAERLRDAGFPDTARFLTNYDLIGRTRRSLATELYCVRPNRELPILVEAVRQALADR